MRLVVLLQVVNLHIDAEFFVVHERAVEPWNNFGRAQHELAGADLLRRNVLEFAAIGDDQRAGFELVVFKARNLQTRVHHADVAALHVLDDDVEPIKAWTQRNGLLINRLELQRLLIEALREIAADWIFKRLHDAAGQRADATKNVERRGIDAILRVERKLIVRNLNRDRHQTRCRWSPSRSPCPS